MEGRSSGKKKRLRVQREFECSRIEQAKLAAAYRRILPDDRVRFTERNGGSLDGTGRRHQRTSQNDHTDCSLHFASAIGGH